MTIKKVKITRTVHGVCKYLQRRPDRAAAK